MERWIDHSKILALRRCPREFYLNYKVNLTRLEDRATIAQGFGKAVHKALQQAFREETLEAARQKALEVFPLELQAELSLLNEPDLEDPRADISTGLSLIDQGFGQAVKDLFNMKEEVIGTEMELEADLDFGWKLLCPADLVLRLRSGQLMLVDIKTTRWRLDSWGSKIVADTQLHLYAYALSKVLEQPDSAAYLVLKFDRRRLRSGAWSPNVSVDSALFPVAVTEQWLRRIEAWAKEAVLEIEGRSAVNQWECDWGSCIRYSYLCQFHPLCERFWDRLPSVEELKEVAFGLGYIEQEWHPFRK